ncbi:MAG: HEAT repeat domain-containing protein [Armatimonadota bacterium]
MEAPVRFFDKVDPSATPEELACQLKQASDIFERHVYHESADDDVCLQHEDKEILQTCYRHADPDIRRAVVDVLVHEKGAADWDGLEQWLMDPDENVRREAVWGVGTGWGWTLNDFQEAECRRLVELIERNIVTYADVSAVAFLHDFPSQYPDCFELVWQTAERLLSVDSNDVWSAIVVGYYEDVLTENNLGPDDPHISSWLTTDKAGVILVVADWMGPEKGRLADILRVLEKSEDWRVTRDARLLLENGRFALRHATDRT